MRTPPCLLGLLVAAACTGDLTFESDAIHSSDPAPRPTPRPLPDPVFVPDPVSDPEPVAEPVADPEPVVDPPPVAEVEVEAPISAVVLPKTAGSFGTAKKWLYERVHEEYRETLYCGCSYDDDKKVNLGSCGLEDLEEKSRAHRVEAEHVVPASRLGGHLPCWTEALCTRSSGATYKGRSCCEKINPVFETAHNDLNNLFPAVGQINGSRRDYSFGDIAGEDRTFGACDFEIGGQMAEPSRDVRGEIARAYLYMSRTYGVELSPNELETFLSWDATDPPEGWEVERNERIAEIQGFGNAFIEP